MIVSGGKRAEDSVELLNTDGTWNCPLPSLPSVMGGHSQSGLVACGAKSCVTLSKDWKESHNLTYERIHHSSWASPRGFILLGGEGWKGLSAMKTSEILTEDGDTTPGFKLGYNSK